MSNARVGVIVMTVLLVATALAIVHVRYQNRTAFLELQAQQGERDRLNVEWGRLLLERGTWAGHQLVQGRARSELGMTVPEPTSTVNIALEEPEPQ